MEPWQLDLVGGLQQGVGTGRDWSSFQPKLWFCESSVLFLTVASRGYQQRGLPEPGVHSLCWRTLHFLSLSYSVVWIRVHFMAPTAFCLRNFTVNCILWRATYFLLNMLLAIFVRRNSKHTVPYALSLCHSWVCSIRFHSFNVLTPPLKLLFHNFLGLPSCAEAAVLLLAFKAPLSCRVFVNIHVFIYVMYHTSRNM